MADSKDENKSAETAEVTKGTGANEYLFQCHIQSLRIGRFQFQDGLLSILSDEELAEFEKVLEGVPRSATAGIRRIRQVAVTETLEASRANRQPSAIRGGVSSSGVMQAAEATVKAQKANK